MSGVLTARCAGAAQWLRLRQKWAMEANEVGSWQFGICVAAGVALGCAYAVALIWAIASSIRGEMLETTARSAERRW